MFDIQLTKQFFDKKQCEYTLKTKSFINYFFKINYKHSWCLSKPSFLVAENKQQNIRMKTTRIQGNPHLTKSDQV